MWTRRQGQQLQLSLLAAIVMLLLGLAAQVGGMKIPLLGWGIFGVAVLVGLGTLWLAWTWHQAWQKWEPLRLGHIDGGLSVDTTSRLYTWEAIVPIQNGDDERPAMTKEIYLTVRRGKRVMCLPPKEPQELEFAPMQQKTFTLHFESVRGLEPYIKEEETEEYEYATIVVIDAHGNKTERALGAVPYSTNV